MNTASVTDDPTRRTQRIDHHAPRMANGASRLGQPRVVSPRPDSTYVIRPGDSLWRIAATAYGDGARWTAIQRANPNEIDEQGNVAVGTVVEIPNEDELDSLEPPRHSVRPHDNPRPDAQLICSSTTCASSTRVSTDPVARQRQRIDHVGRVIGEELARRVDPSVADTTFPVARSWDLGILSAEVRAVFDAMGARNAGDLGQGDTIGPFREAYAELIALSPIGNEYRSK